MSTFGREADALAARARERCKLEEPSRLVVRCASSLSTSSGFGPEGWRLASTPALPGIREQAKANSLLPLLLR